MFGGKSRWAKGQGKGKYGRGGEGEKRKNGDRKKVVGDRNLGSVMSLKEKVRETCVCNTTVTKSGDSVKSARRQTHAWTVKARFFFFFWEE